MTGCCQGTSNPTGKLCKDCPAREKQVPSSDILDPKDIAARMKAAGTFDKDEPWPGWNGGKKLVTKDEPDPQVDEGVEIPCEFLPRQDAWLADQFFANLDYAKIEERVLAMLGISAEEWNGYSDAEKGAHVHKVFGGMFASGGMIFPRDKSRELFKGYGGVVKSYPDGIFDWSSGEPVPNKPHFIAPTGRKWRDEDAAKDWLEDNITINALDAYVNETILTKMLTAGASKYGKRYLTRAEVASVKVGTVCYEDERGRVWREERVGLSLHEQKRIEELSNICGTFTNKSPCNWTPGEARMYADFRARLAWKERGYRVRKRQRVERGIPIRTYPLHGIEPDGDKLFANFGHRDLWYIVANVLTGPRYAHKLEDVPPRSEFDTLCTNGRHDSVRASWPVTGVLGATWVLDIDADGTSKLWREDP